jgi:NADPH:quinone reductase-like Zn-dependent oxidoreductase
MRAWRVHQLGEPAEVLTLDEGVAEPVAGPGEILIDVAACALNFPDALLCRGGYQERPPLPFTPGLEVAGRVRALGPGAEARGLQIGQRVAAQPTLRSGRGGLAEVTVAPMANVHPVPDSLDDAAAAALIVTYQTGWSALSRRAALQAGETLLVHAGAGGVGSAAIQLGKALGATVIATAGGPAKVDVCRRLGADHAIDYATEDFVARVNELTDGRGADVVYDPVGGDVYDRSTKCIAWEGRILIIGFTGGRIAQAATNHVLVKNYSVVGVHWGNYRIHDPAQVDRWHDELMDLHHRGLIAPLVSERVAFGDVPERLVALTNRGTTGKLVVDVR